MGYIGSGNQTASSFTAARQSSSLNLFESYFATFHKVDPNADQEAKTGQAIKPNYLKSLARLEGFEPPTHGLEVRCSVLLSYRRFGFGSWQWKGQHFGEHPLKFSPPMCLKFIFS